MKQFLQILKVKWVATWMSVATMVMSPVVMGQEAENLSAQQLKSIVAEMGLNKKITMGEFYEKNKHLYPERIRKQLEPVFTKYKNVLMPEMTVSSAKGPDGREIAHLSASQGGQLYNLQFFGEKDRFIKFQNTNLTETDIINFNDMFGRVANHDANLRKQFDTPAQAKKTDGGFPALTKEMWKSMTPEQRAEYFLHLRGMWSDARKVLDAQQLEKGKGRKTSSLDKFEILFNSLFADADAAPGDAKPKATATASKKPQAPISRAEIVNRDAKTEHCLVAGYVTTYRNGICDHENIFKPLPSGDTRTDYSRDPLVSKAQGGCSTGTLACNPYVFGVNSSGSAICIKIDKSSNSDFQKATHFNGPCERDAVRLSTNINFLKNPDKKQGRYADGNMSLSEEEIRQKIHDEQASTNFAATKEFLERILKFQGKDNPFNSEIIPTDTLKMLKSVTEEFNKQIKEAKESCIAASNSNYKHEKNFWEACDQLHRRRLFVADFLQQKCPEGSKIDNESFMCACPVGNPVNPGAKCEAPKEEKKEDPPKKVDPPQKEDPPKVDKVVQCEAPLSNQGGKCLCDGGKEPKTSMEDGLRVYSCNGVPVKQKDKDKGFNFGSFLEKLLPWGVVLGAAAGMYYLWKPKKTTPKPPGDTCPNGQPAPCGQVCPLYQAVQSNGQCGCPACPPTQTLTNAAICKCDNPAPPVTPVLLTCPDGVTKVDNLSKCPLSFKCWDGSTVTNPINCPEKPATVIPKTGTQR